MTSRPINKEKMSSYSNALKVPMIILVIFVHENLNLTNDGYLGLMLAAISNVAVPVFFLISGYYFFYGHQFCKEEYFRKIIKRSRTLLLPYLIWNLLPMMNIVAGNLFSIIFRGKSTEALQTYFAELLNNGFWHIWWDITGGTMPYDSPLWYVRDLMIMCILSPIAYLYIKRLKSWGMGILAILYLAGVNTGVVGLSMSAIVFFILGGHFSINAAITGSPCDFALKWRWAVVPMAVLSLVLYLLFHDQSYAHICQMSYILSGVFASYYLMNLMPEKMLKTMSVMASSVFFIYALHNTCVLAWCAGMINRWSLPHYFVIVILPFVTFAVCYALYYLLKKALPQVLAVLCGGRI